MKTDKEMLDEARFKASDVVVGALSTKNRKMRLENIDCLISALRLVRKTGKPQVLQTDNYGTSTVYWCMTTSGMPKRIIVDRDTDSEKFKKEYEGAFDTGDLGEVIFNIVAGVITTAGLITIAYGVFWGIMWLIK